MLNKIRGIPLRLYNKWKRLDKDLRESLARAYFAGMALFITMIIPSKGSILITPVLLSFFNVYVVDLFLEELKKRKYEWRKPARFLVQILVNSTFMLLVMLFYKLSSLLYNGVVLEPAGFSVSYYIYFRICRRLKIM